MATTNRLDSEGCSGDSGVGVTLLLSSAMRLRSRLAILVGLPFLFLVVPVAVYVSLHDSVRGAAFVVKAAGMQGAARTLAEWEADEVSERRIAIPSPAGALPGREYLPRGARRLPFLLVPGIHASGVDEPRLVSFATDLASMGHPVITVGPPDLARYTIGPGTTDAIETAALWLAARRDLAPDGRIGMMGISFAGGLSIVAAGRPALKDKVAVVLSLGGHGDLGRTLRYLCTGRQADGGLRPPHDYGVVIILLDVADQVVPADQVDMLRDALLTFLEASRLDLVDKAQSAATFAKATALEPALAEPSRTLMGYVNRRRVEELGTILLPHVSAMSEEPGISPATAPPPAAPVYLLHGADDNVIPAAESLALGRLLGDRGVETHVLATPLITHAEVDRESSVADILRLVSFWAGVLGE
jgi:dienelactone hydrolase